MSISQQQGRGGQPEAGRGVVMQDFLETVGPGASVKVCGQIGAAGAEAWSRTGLASEESVRCGPPQGGRDEAQGSGACVRTKCLPRQAKCLLFLGALLKCTFQGAFRGVWATCQSFLSGSPSTLGDGAERQ